jgi:glucosylglycerate synthase
MAARRFEAQACGLVDANLIGVAPGWIYQLLQPVIQGEADYVSPAYTRAISEGTLTTNLVAPMTRALYGKRIREVMGGCAGLSAKLAGRFLQTEIWANDLNAYGMELGLTTEALASGAKLTETHLGRKVVISSPGEPDLTTILAQVTGSLFSLMERYQPVWEAIEGSSLLPQTEMPAPLLSEVGEARVERMVRAFRMGLKDLLPVWEQIMPEETLSHLYPLGVLAADEFRFPPPVWARVVSDFALAFHERRLPREHLLRALTPLYLGRVAAFLVEASLASPSRFPDLLEDIGRAFEGEKDSLRARWR